MAREERVDGNLGDLDGSRRANCESQSGRLVQRQEVRAEAHPGIRSVHSSRKQGASPDSGQWADSSTQPVQETSAVRMTETRWSTSLRASRRVEMKSPVRYVVNLVMWCQAGNPLIHRSFRIFDTTYASNVMHHIWCGKTARRDLCGGRRVTGVPTATNATWKNLRCAHCCSSRRPSR